MPLRPMGREQMWMLPPTLDELLPLDHPARFVVEFVDALGRDAWAELGVDIEGDSMGAPAYHPRALLSVWLYGFMTGVRSCQIPCLERGAVHGPYHGLRWSPSLLSQKATALEDQGLQHLRLRWSFLSVRKEDE